MTTTWKVSASGLAFTSGSTKSSQNSARKSISYSVQVPDRLVYVLYDLTEEEMAIVEEAGATMIVHIVRAVGQSSCEDARRPSTSRI